MEKPNPTPTPPDLSLLDALPRARRNILRQFLLSRDADPRAAEYNERIIGFAKQGLQGDALGGAASTLHDEMFGDRLTRAANTAHFQELLETNRAGEIDCVVMAVVKTNREIIGAMIGDYDLPYVQCALEAMADAFDRLVAGGEPVRRTSELPPPTGISPEATVRNRAEIDAVLRELVGKNERGEIAGSTAVVLAPPVRAIV